MVGPCPAVAAARERPLTARSPYAGLPGGGRLPRDLRNRRGEQIRHAGAVGVVVPQNCGWRHRRFELVSCRFGVEIGARVIIRSHCGPAVPSVYLGEPPKGAFGPPRLLGASRIRGKQAWRKSKITPRFKDELGYPTCIPNGPVSSRRGRVNALGLTPGCHPPPHANSVTAASGSPAEGTTSSGVLSEDQPAQVPPNSELVGAH